MVDEVLKALCDWEALDNYVTRTGNLVLRCIPPEDGVVVFVDREPWILNLEATVIDRKLYIKTP
jgi:hypothetical protein